MIKNQSGFGIAEIFMVAMTLIIITGGVVFVISSNNETGLDEQFVEQPEKQRNPDAAGSGKALTEVFMRDKQRRANMLVVQQELEEFFAENNGYPRPADYNDEQWRRDNLYTDPANEDVFAEYPIVYNVRPGSCDNDTFVCASYDITVDLEEDGLGEEDADNDTDDAIRISIN